MSADSEMVERVARAICKSGGRDPDSVVSHAVTQVVAYNPIRTVSRPNAINYPAWHECRIEARAAILAMREPTEAMVGAMLIAIGTRRNGRPVTRGEARQAILFVIDAALAG